MTELQKIHFNDAKARTFRKRVEVLAFRSEDSVIFEKKWGEQRLREGSWIIIPLTDDGRVTQDIYGCDGAVFPETYERSPSLRPNQFRKKETVQAYQPGVAFEIDTILPDGYVEVASSKADSCDSWIVKGPKGELYPIENDEFRRTYVEVVS